MNEIVIKIDDVDYEYIKNGCIIPIKIDNHIYDAIRNGKVLPKGHGKIIEVTPKLEASLGTYQRYTGIDEAPYEYASEELAKAKTVVEADKGEE